MTKKVLVIGGTVDARGIIDRLLKEKVKVVATVTTELGKELMYMQNGLDIITGKLNKEEMLELINSRNINCLVDASHPFAIVVSENAMHAAKTAMIPYIRYERNGIAACKDDLIRVKDHEEAANTAKAIQGNIFLTVGSNSIEVYTRIISDYRERIFARVLSDSKVIEKCEGLGLSANNIIAMKGPFSEGLNVQMLKYCNAKVLVTKNSGDAGGTMEKLSAARILQIPVIMIERPHVDYVNVTNELESVIQFVWEVT